jgi:hypothetical protein
MTRIIGLILLLGIIAGAVAYQRTFGGAREDVIALAKMKIAASIERLKTDRVVEERKTALALARIERDKADAERQARIESAGVVVWMRTARAVAWYGLPIIIGGVGLFAGVSHVRRVSLQTPTVSGRFPLQTAERLALASLQLQSAEAAGRVMAHSEDITRARLSDVLGFARLFGRGRELPYLTTAGALPEATTMTQTADLPSFIDIFESREPGGEMVLGYSDAAEPRLGRYEAVHSCLVYGTAGSGKTSWLRGLTGQTVLTAPDSRVFVLDPHAARKDSLFKSLPKTPHFQAIDAERPEPFLQGFRDELRRRLLSDEQEFAPRVLLIDELNEVARKDYKPLLVKTCEEVAQQGRKVNVFLIASAQDLREKKIGDFRASLSSAYFFKGKSSQVKAFLDDNDAAKLYRQNVTRQGVALFSSADDEPRLTVVPECKAADVRRVAELLATDDTRPPTQETLETPQKRDETDKTPFLSDDDFRAFFVKRIDETGETLSGLAARVGVNKGGFYKFLKDGATASDAMRSRFSSFLGRCESVSTT